MTSVEQENRNFWTGFAVLLLVGILLGVRAENATRAVLGFEHPAATAGKSIAGVPTPSLAGIAHRDSLIAAAAASDRDPFHGAAAPRAYRPAAADTSRPQPAPVIRALLFDPNNAEVKLGLGPQSSGWLHQGESFGGWTVVQIKPKSVWISRNGNNVYLSSP